MPISFTQAYKEALASAPTDVTTIDTLKMDHSTFPQPLYFAKSEYDIQLDGQLYLARQFDFKLPETSSKSNASLQITIGDVARKTIRFVDAAVVTTEPITVLFQSWILGVSGPQAGFSTALESNNVTLKNKNVVLGAGYPDLVNLKLPRVVYTTEEFPGLR